MNKPFNINDMYTQRSNQQVNTQQQALNLAQQSISLAQSLGHYQNSLGSWGTGGYGNNGWGITQAEQDILDYHWLIEEYKSWVQHNKSSMSDNEFQALHQLTYGRKYK